MSTKEVSREEVASLLRKWKADRRLIHWKLYFSGIHSEGVGRVEELDGSNLRIDARSYMAKRGDLNGCMLDIRPARFSMFGADTAPPELGMPPGVYDIALEGQFPLTGAVCHLFSVKTGDEIDAGLR